MNDGRARRKAKQERRDAVRRKNHQRRRAAPEDEAWLAEVRRMLTSGHPLELLSLASTMGQAAKPKPFAWLRRDEPDPIDLAKLVHRFARLRIPETSALLTVLAEVVDDDVLRTVCRRALAARRDGLPEWLAGLAKIEAYRAVRMTHVLGDTDDVVIGARFPAGQELTCVVRLDHDNTFSEVIDAYFVPKTICSVLAAAQPQIDDPDISFVELGLADARAWIAHGIEHAEQLFALHESDSWPDCRPLLQWLICRLPDNGEGYQRPQWSWGQTRALLAQFFASPAGRPFDDFDCRSLLSELCSETGAGDPLRWSVARVEQVLKSPAFDQYVPADALLAVPDLLRAYVPFAHAQSGIRHGLTSATLAAIDECRPSYQQSVREERYWDGDDEVEAS